MRNPARSGALFPEVQAVSNGLPAEVVGCWRCGDSQYEITPNGQYLIVGASEFNVSEDGRELVFPAPGDDMIFLRKYGVGRELAGVWARTFHDPDTPNEPPLEEEILFRSDGTDVWHWKGEFDSYYGTYSRVGEKLVTRELRAIVICEGSTITFVSLWGLKFEGTYVLRGDEFIVSFPERTMTYRRCACI